MAIPFDKFNQPEDPCNDGIYEWFERNHDVLSYTDSYIASEAVSHNGDLRPPTGHGIYFLVYQERIAYVGRARNIELRLQEHEISGKQFDSYWCIGGIPYELLPEVEGYYISRLKPYLNRYRVACGSEVAKVEKRYKALWRDKSSTYAGF